MAESVGVTQVGAKGYSKAALDAMKFAPVVGMTWGGKDNKMLEMFLPLIRGSLLLMFLPLRLRA
jgi:hypothetical protein